MSTRRFKKGDRVLIASLKSAVTRRTWLSPSLKETPQLSSDIPVSNTNKTPNGYPPNTPLIHLNFGKLAHSDIIDSMPSSKIYELITAQKGLSAKYRVSHPTLEEYINLTNRKAQPIYALDAASIVTLMDIHLDAPVVEWESNGKPKIKEVTQFLEAGTGHGSLSLAIAKQLQPSNVLSRIMPDADQVDYRGAILHSIDCNKSHSFQGKETVDGFRRGQYSQNVEFHLSDSPSEWLETDECKKWSEKSIPIDKESIEFKSNGSSWLDGVFLDMPSYDKQLIRLCKDLKIDGKIITFCPSINQILDGIKEIDQYNEITIKSLDEGEGELPFTSQGGEPAKMIHEKTIQLLPGMGGGLQEWDTRKTLIKATGETGYTVRPKVGMRTVAGGFISIWRKVGLTEQVYGQKKAEPVEDTEVIEDTEETHVDTATDIAEAATANATDFITEEEITKATSKFKSYTFETTPTRTVSEPTREPEFSNIKAPVSDFMKRFLSEEPLPAPETKQLELTPEEQEEADKANTHIIDEYEIKEDTTETRLFPMESLNTVYKNCSGEVHVGYVTRVNVIDVGKLPEYAFEGQIKPTGPENSS